MSVHVSQEGLLVTEDKRLIWWFGAGIMQHCDMDFSQYPFDLHMCPVSLMSAKSIAKDLVCEIYRLSQH